MASAATMPVPHAPWPTGKVDGHLVYAIGDIHGCYDQLQRLLTAIASDAKVRSRGRVAILIFCGDYVDRGPASRQVLDALCWLKRHGSFEVQFLKGNHEQVMLDYISSPADAVEWLRFGGVETMISYGVAPPSSASPPAVHIAARDDLLERLPVSHLRFLEELDLIVGIGDYAFVHAGIRPGVPLADQLESDLLWIRDEFLDFERPHERIIVHGHTWNGDQPQMESNRIGIDTGTYQTGVLTALCIEDDGVAVLSVR
jgi:serine/threonine protein phosphatase 1